MPPLRPTPTPRSTATQTPPVRQAVPPASGSYHLPLPAAPVDPLQAQALSQAQNSILPQVQSLAAQRATAAANTAQTQQSTEQAYQALAGILKGISPMVGGAYRTAGLDQAMLAKGFTDGLAHIQSQAAAQTAPQLGTDSPQQAQATAALGGTGAQNALYALGGYIPASGLNREGAAFSSAAAQLPATAAGQGLQQVQALGAKQALTDAGFDAKQADLLARVPGLAQTALDHLNTAKATADYHAATLKQRGDYEAASLKQRDTALQQSATRINNQAAYEGATLKMRGASYELAVNKASASQALSQSKLRGYVANPDGSPVGGVVTPIAGYSLGPNGAVVKNSSSSKSSSPVPGFGGLSASGLKSLAVSANGVAAKAAKGVPPSEHWASGATAPTPYGGTPPTQYTDALQQVFALGPHTQAWAQKATQIVNSHYPLPTLNADGSFDTQIAYRPFAGKMAVSKATEMARAAHDAGAASGAFVDAASGLGVFPPWAIQKAAKLIFKPAGAGWLTQNVPPSLLPTSTSSAASVVPTLGAGNQFSQGTSLLPTKPLIRG